MLTKVFGSAVFGVEATTITVEVHVDTGIGYHLVGLPDNAIKESNFRIAAALQNNGYKIPGKKIILNMSPADLSGCNAISPDHISEAIQYRSLDRDGWFG